MGDHRPNSEKRDAIFELSFRLYLLSFNFQVCWFLNSVQIMRFMIRRVPCLLTSRSAGILDTIAIRGINSVSLSKQSIKLNLRAKAFMSKQQ